MKLTPVASAALSSAFASFSGLESAPAISATGVTAMRLFTMGTPYSRSMAQPTATSFSAALVTLS